MIFVFFMALLLWFDIQSYLLKTYVLDMLQLYIYCTEISPLTGLKFPLTGFGHPFSDWLIIGIQINTQTSIYTDLKNIKGIIMLHVHCYDHWLFFFSKSFMKGFYVQTICFNITLTVSNIIRNSRGIIEHFSFVLLVIWSWLTSWWSLQGYNMVICLQDYFFDIFLGTLCSTSIKVNSS